MHGDQSIEIVGQTLVKAMAVNLVGRVDMATGARVIVGELRMAFLHEAQRKPRKGPPSHPALLRPVRLSAPASLRDTSAPILTGRSTTKPQRYDRGPRSNPHDLFRHPTPLVATGERAAEQSVLQRSVAASGRTGYQWTRKVAQKTVSVSLSQAQFVALKTAVANERKLWKTVQQMERISRQIIFASTLDTNRRKRLTKKVLGTI